MRSGGKFGQIGGERDTSLLPLAQNLVHLRLGIGKKPDCVLRRPGLTARALHLHSYPAAGELDDFQLEAILHFRRDQFIGDLVTQGCNRAGAGFLEASFDDV